jgi:hypothetical protein
LLASPQMQVPLPQPATQDGLSPAHSTWHGGVEQGSSQLAPAAQTHLPSGHSSLQHSPMGHG